MEAAETGTPPSIDSPKMGPTDQASYDEDKVFSHLIVYIDSDENAEQNGLDVAHKASDTDMDE